MYYMNILHQCQTNIIVQAVSGATLSPDKRVAQRHVTLWGSVHMCRAFTGYEKSSRWEEQIGHITQSSVGFPLLRDFMDYCELDQRIKVTAIDHR